MCLTQLHSDTLSCQLREGIATSDNIYELEENQALEHDVKKKEISFINSRAYEGIILELQHTFPGGIFADYFMASLQ